MTRKDQTHTVFRFLKSNERTLSVFPTEVCNPYLFLRNENLLTVWSLGTVIILNRIVISFQ